jgi:hypothetical protein
LAKKWNTFRFLTGLNLLILFFRRLKGLKGLMGLMRLMGLKGR